MRIELPSATWADTVNRAEDDAHTLTLAPTPLPGWVEGPLLPQPALTLSIKVPDSDPVVLSITL